MTTKQIAQAVGKDERSVQRWVKAVGDKMSSVSDKMSSSSPAHPADYTLDEACQIIEQGMGAAAAGVYRANAAQPKAEKPAKAKLPTGAQINALARIYPAPDLCKRIDYIIGYPSAAEPKLYIPERTDSQPVDHAIMARGLSALGTVGKLSPAVFTKARQVAIAAGQRVIDAEVERLARDSKQGGLM